MGGGGTVLTGVRGCEDGWETQGKNCEKTVKKNQWERTVGNKTKGKKTGKNTGEKTKRCDARLTKNTGELRWS